MKNIFEDNSSEKNAAQNQNEAAQGQIRLTPQQLNALLSQIVIVNENENKPQEEPQPKSASEPAPPAQQDNNPGKKILFQSEDFDSAPQEPKEEVKKERTLADVIEEEESQNSFFDDDDDIFLEKEGMPLTKEKPQIKPGVLSGSFSVAEEEFSEKELPALKRKKVGDTAAASRPEVKRMGERLHSEPPKPGFNLPSSGNSKPAANSPFSFTPAAGTIKITEEELPLNVPKKSKGKFFALKGRHSSPQSKEKKKLPVSEIIRRVILAAAIIAIIISSAKLLYEYKLHKDNENLEKEVSNLIIDEAETTKKPKKQNQKVSTTKATETTLSAEEQWAQIKKQYPNVNFPEKLQLKYAKLYATNQDFVGYLSADGINMGLPIVQTNDDDTYLEKSFYGKKTKYGCPFVTYSNNLNPLDMNTVIFGHHMNDGTVFGILDEYKSIEGFKKAPVITFNTIYGDYKWKIISAFVTNAREEDDNGYLFRYYFTSLSTPERFGAYLNELAQRSLYDTGVDVTVNDKILTLSTCSHEFEDARFVVVARLLRSGESEAVNVKNAVENKNPRYPQAYYTKNKLDNPFVNASRWYVD